MDPTVMPTSGPFNSSPGGGSRSPILPVLVIVLGLGTVIFGVLTVTFSTKAATATKVLNTQKAAAASKARDDQKAADTILNARALESPFRTYTAPESDGSFVINFPKSWSSSLVESSHGTQVLIEATPDSFKNINGAVGLIAARIAFIDETKAQATGQYAGSVKKGTIKETDITVAGQPALSYTGLFGDKKTVRQVIVPIRDKVLIFTTEVAQYDTEFNEILAQAKIIP